MDIVAGLACISEVQPLSPVFFIERNSSLNWLTLDQLLDAAKCSFPGIAFHTFALDQDGLRRSGSSKNLGFRNRIYWIRELRARVAVAVQETFGLPLEELNKKVDTIYFSNTNDYTRVLLEACRECPRALYPHGFDHPRQQQIQETPFLFQPRGLLTAVRSLQYMKAASGIGEPIISSIYRLGRRKATCFPYDGTDKVYTFRESTLEISTELVRLNSLKKTFQWLTSISPWREELEKARCKISQQSVILLLSEYSRNPIWENNRNWAEAHLAIARATLSTTGTTSLVIKSHPRSDGTAAAYLHYLAMHALPQVTCHLLPDSLSILPIEALALALEFSAACSLGSCSLPGDIGIDIPHYTSSRISTFFDEGWNGIPFWAKFGQIAQMLVSEGISRDIDTLA